MPQTLSCGLIAAVLTLGPARANAACSIQIVAPVAFGNYNVFASNPTTAVGSFTVNKCTPAAPYVATFSAGSSGNVNARTMLSGANVLSYNLYSSAAYTSVLGGIGVGVSISGNGVASNGGTIVSIYGRILAGQDVAASATPYSDNVTITITF